MRVLFHRNQNPTIPENVKVVKDHGIKTFYIEAKGGGCRRISGRDISFENTPELHQWLKTQQEIFVDESES